MAATGSAAILDQLERSNLFLVPLDDERTLVPLPPPVRRRWPGSSSSSRVPSGAQALHSRALEWFRDHGHIDEAVKHALAAGRTTDAAALVRENWMSYVDTILAATVPGAARRRSATGPSPTTPWPG